VQAANAPSSIDELAARLRVDDVLVFVRDGPVARLIGGAGRGAGWAGTVSVEVAAEPLLREAIERGIPVRRVGMDAERAVGPYWVAHAAAVPVGDDHVVLFGAERRIAASDGELFRAAAEAAAGDDVVSPAKLLADELEVVHAVRQLMAHRPETIEATATHIARTAAGALSCELGAVLVRHGDRWIAATSGAETLAVDDGPALHEALARLLDRAAAGPLVEQELGSDDDDALGAAAGLVARFAVPIGRERPIALLVVGHAEARPRGFTNLCQRVGRAIADAAELLLGQAITREELTAERDRFAREARTDSLTGLTNRIGWDQAMEAESARWSRYGRPVAIVTADLDDLKATNDRFGHEAGDRLLRAAADALRGAARETDLVARVGGDEFLVLLPETDDIGAREYIERVRQGAAAHQGALPRLRLSLGWAIPEPGSELADAVRAADRRMYEEKAARELGHRSCATRRAGGDA
jgi:diguanylate cyclase